MRAHTKMLHTKNYLKHSSKYVEEEQALSADDIIKKICGKRPEWAVALRGYRYRENLTQADLGNLLGIDQSNISKMERGTRAIGKAIAKKLAKLFKIDYHVFL